MFIEVDKNTEFVVKGGSKFYGAPDVTADFEWPYIVDEDDEFDLEFLCQLNCEDLAERCNLIKKKGMLYFFIDPLSEKWYPENLDAVRVVYSNSDIKDLNYIDSIDQNGESIGYPELKIVFDPSVLLNTHNLIEIMTQNEKFVTLIKLNSEILSYAGIELSEKCCLEVFTEEERVLKGDFSNVRVKVVSI